MASGSKGGADTKYSDSENNDQDYIQMVENYSEDEGPVRSEAIEKSMMNLNIGVAKMLRQLKTLAADFKELCPNNVDEENMLREEVMKLVIRAQELRNKHYNNDDSENGDQNYIQMVEDYSEDESPDRSEVIEKSLTDLNIGVANMLEQLETLAVEFKELCANHVVQKKMLREEVMKLVVKTQELRNKHYTNK